MKLGDRMKLYEKVSRGVLPARLPVIMRLDGNSFSQLDGFEKPFDEQFETGMRRACEGLIKYCDAEFAYSQSDEISLLLRNDKNRDQTPFLANRIQKLVSLFASRCSVEFNIATDTQVMFDARAFVLPEHEVVNYFIWRQEDAFKNCISSVAYYGLKEKYGNKTAQKMLRGVSTDQQQGLIFDELNQNPNDIETKFKRGFVVQREAYEITMEDAIEDSEKLETLIERGYITGRNGPVIRSRLVQNTEIPRFTQNVNS